jgi:hypothetical protein
MHFEETFPMVPRIFDLVTLILNFGLFLEMFTGELCCFLTALLRYSFLVSYKLFQKPSVILNFLTGIWEVFHR